MPDLLETWQIIVGVVNYSYVALIKIRSLSVCKFTTKEKISEVYCGTYINLARNQILIRHLPDLPDRFLQLCIAVNITPTL